jgi:hypothetical protein
MEGSSRLIGHKTKLPVYPCDRESALCRRRRAVNSRDSQLCVLHPCMVGLDTGNQAAVYCKEVFCLLCFAHFVKSGGRLHVKYAKIAAWEL